MPSGEHHPIDLSVVAPAHNEQDNVRPLIEQIAAALDPTGRRYEIVIIDDGSTDSTAERLRALLPRFPQLRVLRMTNTRRAGATGSRLRFTPASAPAAAP